MENDPASPESPAAGIFGVLAESPGRDRRRLDLALSTARTGTADSGPGTGIPGLRQELFPAAAWKRELESLQLAERRRSEERERREQVRLRCSLAGERAEDILRRARSEARKLVGAASAVARTRRRQAETAAAVTLAEAGRLASRTLAAARRQAAETSPDPGMNVEQLHQRLLRLQTSLAEAEARLGAFVASARDELAAGGNVVDLDAEQRRGEREGRAVAPESDPRRGHRASRVRPKSRFTAVEPAPDRLASRRDDASR